MKNKSALEWQNIQTLKEFQLGQAVVIYDGLTQYGFVNKMKLNTLGEIVLGVELIVNDISEPELRWLHPYSTKIKKVVDIFL
jgi:hypothetical protein